MWSLESGRWGGVGGVGGSFFASDEGHVLTGAGPFFIFKSKQAACGGLGGYGKGGNSDANQAGAHFPPPTIKQNKSGNTEKRQTTVEEWASPLMSS